MSISYKNLYTQVNNLIDSRIKYNGALPYKSQQAHTDIAPFALQSTGGDVSANELIGSVMQILIEVVPPRILNGLEVEATSPISDSIIVRAGKGTAGGSVYELTEDTTCQLVFNASAVYYVNLYPSRLVIENTQAHLTVAKIVVPKPGFTSLIQDTSDGGWNAYIQSFKEYRLFGFNDKFEEDTQALLRDNIGSILADNIIGNIRLSENLKISNTSGTMLMDSNQITQRDYDGNLLTKWNPSGIYFYRIDGYELAKFSTTGARIGNISILPNSIESANFISGTSGFQINSLGEAEFNNVAVRGTIYGTSGQIGGWTIGNNRLYATTTGIISTGSNVGSGQNGCIFDKDGMRVYDSILGVVVNFPSDGSVPTISAGNIGGVTFEVNTNTVIRTSAEVGDGGTNSAGILINNTGMYACETNQLLSNANLKILATGDAYFKGTITATSGQIGNVVITPTSLIGGLIIGSEIIGAIIETSVTLPRIRMDSSGIYYQVTESIGQFNTFKYNDGTKYGSGVSAYLFNVLYPVLSIVAESNLADIRLFNRLYDPGSGTGPHTLGDLIVVGGVLKICTVAGSPGTFSSVVTGVTFLALVDTPDSYSGQGLKTVRVNSGASALEFVALALSDLANTSFAAPGADRLVFWDQSAGQYTFLSLSGLSITTTTLYNSVAIETVCLSLTPEYPGAVMYADGSSNSVIITATHDQTNHMNYYELTSDATNDYDIVIQIRVPENFNTWNSNAQKIYVWTDDTSTCTLTCEIFDTTGTTDGSDTITPASNSTWTTKTLTTPAGTYANAGYFHIHLKGSIASTGKKIRFGWIELAYTRKVI